MPASGKRVLMLVENLPYPRDARVRQEALALTAAGYAVTVIAQCGRGQPGREWVEGVRVYRYPAPPPGHSLLGYAWEYGYSLAAMFVLAAFVAAAHGFDVIHTANPPDTAVLIAAFYKLFGRTRFVFDQHDLAPELYDVRFNGRGRRQLARDLLIALEALSYRLADHVIATNASYQAVAMARGRVPAERITIVRNGPALDRWQPAAPDPGLRQRAGTILGYVGVIAPQDGLDYLLRALAHLRADLGRSDFLCVVVGEGEALPDLKALAARLGLEGQIWFTGFLAHAELIRCLSSADICVDPDPSNAFNDRCTMTKLMEYMALGKPIVAFDLPEHRVTAQEAAVYARANDELDFARQIAALMDDPARRRQMGARGRQRVESELSWPHQQAHLLAAYRALEAVNRSVPSYSQDRMNPHDRLS
ncbi:MAG: glycosyltransferase family 4 protein [Anaerolineales bacterium]